MEPTENLVGANVARLRAIRHWSQRELAEQLHTDQAMVARWEKGRVTPRKDTIQRLAQLFEVDEDELLSVRPTGSQLVVKDPDLVRLFAQTHALAERDRESLKAVIEAMIMRSQIKTMVLPQVAYDPH